MLLFLLNSALLGLGLAMDTFSVSMANGLKEPGMKRLRVCGMCGIYAGFQFAMPLIGWFFIHTALSLFHVLEAFIPWIALLLLCWIGGRMVLEGIHETGGASGDGEAPGRPLTPGTLVLQGIATSIDALSIGFTTALYGPFEAFMSSVIIGAVTFVISLSGFLIGRIFGTRLAGRSAILGGVILIAIGLEIFFSRIL